MPPLISRERLRRILCTTALTAVLGGLAPAAAAACSTPSGGSELLEQFGDTNEYTLAPGGSFENGTPGWSLTRASVVSGNEPYYVDGSGSHSLSISPTGVVVTSPICVSNAIPSFRFFARQTSGSWAEMNVNILWTDPFGRTHSTTVGSINGATSWFLSGRMELGSALPLWQPGSTLLVRLQFRPAGSGGGWQIDDVNVDPYSRH